MKCIVQTNRERKFNVTLVLGKQIIKIQEILHTLRGLKIKNDTEKSFNLFPENFNSFI